MHSEIGILPDGLVCKYLVAAALEKARRVPPDHSRRIPLEAPVLRHRTTRQSWRVLANDVIGGTSLRGTETKPLFGSPAPVPLDPRRCSITPDLPGYARKGTTGILDSAKECIDHWLPDIVIYTDGSVAGGIHDGGSAAVVTRGEASSPDVIKVLHGRGSRLTCSYEAEMLALSLAVGWIEEQQPPGRILIASDSQAALRALEADHPSGSPAVKDLRRGSVP